jgi:DNA polymerase III subunit gamma/tau
VLARRVRACAFRRLDGFGVPFRQRAHCRRNAKRGAPFEACAPRAQEKSSSLHPYPQTRSDPAASAELAAEALVSLRCGTPPATPDTAAPAAAAAGPFAGGAWPPLLSSQLGPAAAGGGGGAGGDAGAFSAAARHYASLPAAHRLSLRSSVDSGSPALAAIRTAGHRWAPEAAAFGSDPSWPGPSGLSARASLAGEAAAPHTPPRARKPQPRGGAEDDGSAGSGDSDEDWVPREDGPGGGRGARGRRAGFAGWRAVCAAPADGGGGYGPPAAASPALAAAAPPPRSSTASPASPRGGARRRAARTTAREPKASPMGPW